MSAFMLDNDGITRVIMAIRHAHSLKRGAACGISGSVTEVGHQLVEMNAHAVCSRYPQDKISEHLFPYVWTRIPVPEPQQLIQSLDCYLYQCSEGDVPNYSLFKKLETVRDFLKSKYPRQPGKCYDHLIWG